MKNFGKSTLNTYKKLARSIRRFSSAMVAFAALFVSFNVSAVDYPTTIDNTVNVTLPAGVIDNNTANNTNGGCTVADPTVAACATDSNALNVVTPEPTKAFAPNPIDFNGISTLTITLTNTNNFEAILQADFVDNLPASVVLATPANASDTCGGTGTLTALDGASSITLGSGATIPANSSCTITADVTSGTAGTHTNQLPAGTLDTGMGASTAASADLVVNSPAEIAINDIAQVETDAGTTTFTFTVSITNAVTTAEDITFEYATADGTAQVVDGDYTGSTGFGQIAAGDTSGTITVDVNGDTVVEPDETFTVTLSNISSNATISDGVGEATIQNDDAASISIADVTVNEGDGTATIDVTLTGDTAAGFDVDFATADDTATAGPLADYLANSGTLSFAGTDGEVQSITVTINDDFAIEGDETFNVNLSNITGGLATINDGTGVVTIQDNDSVVLIEFDAAADTADESITDEPRLRILGFLPNDTNVNVNVTGGTATGSGTDYTNVVTVTIPAGTYDGGAGTSVPINLTVVDDNILEADETINFEISSVNPRLVLGDADLDSNTQATNTYTIQDNDPITVTVAANDATAAEPADNGQFTVSLSNPNSVDTTVTYTIAGTATPTDDYTPLTGTVTIPAGDTSAAIDVTVADDTIVEGDETVVITLATTSDGTIDPGNNEATVTIADNDVAELEVLATSVVEGDAGTTTLVYTVQFANAVSTATDVTFDFATSDGTATTADNDYIAVSSSGTITAGNTSTTVSVTVNGDLTVEADETVALTISNPSSNATITTASADGTITNDDAAEVSIAAIADTTEGSGIAGQFTVSLSNPSDTDTVVDISVGGTATAGADYASLVTSVTIPANTTSVNLNVLAIDDSLLEPTETVIVTLDTVTSGNATIGTPNNATVNIFDNDAASIAIDDVTVDEADGNAVFTVTLTGNVQGGFTVDAATADDTALAGSDYTTTTDTLSFAGNNGETQTFTVPITDDGIAEATETFFANLSNISNGLVTIADAQGIGSITDNDNASLAINDVTVNEGDGTAVFTVTLTGDVQGGVSVDYATADDTALAASDYTSSTGTINFVGTDGETQTFSVPITDDGLVEATETFFANLSNVSNAVVTLADDQGIGTINDNDNASLAINDVTVNEADGNAVFTVTLTGDVQGGVSVDFATADDTANAGSDYTAQTGTLNFTGTDGEALTITVPITDDAVAEASETYFVDLSNVSNVGVTLSDAQGLGTINDNDTATLTINNVTIDEDAGTATYTVTLDNAVQGGSVVNYSFTDGTATGGVDYDNTPGSVTFAGTAGETQTFTVAIINDGIYEGNETFTVNLNAVNPVINDNDSATTIIDDEVLEVSVTASVANASEPATNGEFTVSLNTPSATDITVNLSYSGTATDPADYSLAGAAGTTTVVIPAGDTSVTVDVVVNDDTTVEPTETVIATIDSVSEGTIVNATDTVEIADDDAAAVTVEDVTANEGVGTVTFTITLNNDVAGGTNVDYSFTDGTATGGGTDYDSTGGTVTFVGTAGETQTFTVAYTDDNIVEGDETFTVSLNADHTGVNDTDTATGTIQDNDVLTVNMSATVAAASEPGTDGEFTITLSNPSDTDTTVFVDYAGTATNTSDYNLTGAAGTTSVTIPAGSTSATVAVEVIDDALVEGSETVEATITAVSNGAIGTPTDTVTITDNDSRVTVEDVSVNEADGTATFTITLEEAIAGGTDVNYSFTDGTATGGGTDYDSTGGTVTFVGTAGETQTFTVAITNDAVVEGDETFTVNLDAVDPNVIDTDTATGTIVDDDALTVSVVATTPTAQEPATDGQFTVSLSTTSATDTTVTIAYSGTATNGSDYNLTGASGTTTVVIPAGSTDAIVTVDVIDDNIVEGDETVIATITATDNGTISGATDTVTIESEDTASVTVEDVTVAEDAGNATFRITLNGEVDGGTDVTYSFTDGSATGGGTDYDSTGNTVSFTGTDGEFIDILVPITNDAIVEFDETFTVNLSASNALVDATDVATGTITDDDSPLVTSIAASVPNASEPATDGEFTISLSAESSTDTIVTIDYTGTANDPSDYSLTGVSGTTTVTIPAGSTSATVTVDVANDNIVEPSETVIATITSVSNGNIGTASDTVTIADDDNAAVTVEDVTVNEGAGTATFTITLDSAVAGGTDVNYSFTDGTATGGGTDYDDTAGTVTFVGTAGETQSFTVGITDDGLVEGDETFTVNLDAVNPQVIDTDTAIGTITDNDNLLVSVIASVAMASEPATDGEFTVSLSAPSATDTTVTLSYTGTAADPADYSLTGANGTTTVVIPAGDTTATITVDVADDLIVEPSETVIATIDTVSNGAIDNATDTVTINDNDAATVSVDDVTIAEDGVNAIFTVTLSGDVAGGVSFDYTTNDGSAAAPGDYTTVSGTETFTGTDGETITISVPIINDTTVEGDETFTLDLSNLNNPGVTFADDQGLGTITDNDAATVAIDDVTVNEADGNAVFTVTLTGDVQGGVSFDYTTTDGTATVADGDYTAASGTETFTGTSGETITISVPITDDAIVEGSETFTVDLSNLTNGGVTFSDDQGLGTITDNDNATVAIDDVTIAEDGANATFTVTLTGEVQGGFTLDYTTNDGTAAAPGDYTTTGGSLSFTGTPGETQTIIVPIINDTTVEGDETFTVDLSNLSNGGVTFSDDQGLGTITDNDAATVAIDDVTVNEADGNAIFTVTLTGDVQGGVSFDYTTNDGSAAAGSDYTATSGIETFTGTSGETVTITVPITDDTLVEGTEDFTVDLTNLTTAGVTFSDNQGLGTINDNDNAEVTVNDVTVNEGAGTATFTVTLDNDVVGGTVVNYSFTDGTATGGTDFDNTAGSVTFVGTAGETQTFDVTITDDTIVEGSEDFTVNIDAVNPLVTDTDTGLGTITDNDNLEVSIAATIAAASEPNTDGEFTVTLSNVSATDTTITINYAGTATDASDYNLTGAAGTTSVVIPAGSTSATVAVEVLDDTLVEGSETVEATITAVSNGTIGTATDTVTIADNDNASVTIEDVTVTEAAGTATFTITLNGDVAGGTDVNYSFTDGTATGGNTDYDSTAGTVTFAGTDGETQTFTVAITDDAIVEGDETFTVNLDAVNPLVTDTDTAIGTINDNDAATVSVDDVTIAEDGVNAIFTVTLSGDVAGGVSFDYTTNDVSAAAPGDYTTVSGTETFTGTDGETITISVPIINDTTVEGDETFTLDLSNLNNPGVTFADDQGLGTITDNDAATVAIDDVTVNEADGNAVFTVTLTGDVQGGVSFDYTTTDGTATVADGDYTAASGTETFTGTSGETVTITVPITDDTIVEGSETFTVDLSNLTNGGVTFSDDQGLGTITDNDAATVAIDDVTIDEAGANATFTVTLTGEVQGGFTLDYTTNDGTAAAPGDYTTTAGSLSFTGTPGETQTIIVPIINDTTVEGDETFTVDLSNLSNGGVTFSDDQGLGTITDNDAATVAIDDVTVNEADGNAIFTVTLTGDVQGGVSFDYTTNDGSAAAGSDYTATSGTETFTGTSGETVTITVPITDDTLVEGTEDFTVDLTNLTTAGVTFSDNQGLGTINDNDNAEVTVNDVTVNENAGTATFTITLDNDVSGGTVVNYSFTDGTATGGDDFDNTAGSVTFVGTAGETQTFDVTITDDTIVEGSEDFTVNIDAVNPLVTDIDTGLGTITDNDNLEVSIAATIAAASEPNTNGQFTVSLNTTSSSDTTVTIGYSGTATDGTDYNLSGASGTTSVVIPAGSTAATVNVNVVDDFITEGDETVIATISAVSNGTIGTATDTVTIADNDAASVTVEDVTVNESAGTATFTITLDSEVAGGTDVNYSFTDGTATGGNTDYDSTAGTVTFVGNASETQTFTVAITNDALVEGDETFTVNLDAVNPLVTDTDTATGTITDDDNLEVSIAATVAAASEPATDGEFTVTLSNVSATDTTVTIGYAGTATDATDYNLTGAAGTTTVVIPAGDTSATVAVEVIDDNIVEGSETVDATITAVSNGTIGTATDTVTIADDDIASVSVADVAVDEDAGTATINVTLTGNTAAGFSVDFATADGTAQAGALQDYIANSGTLNFVGNDGEVQSITVTINDDFEIEGDETFNVNLSNITGGQATINDGTGVVTIQDNDTVVLIEFDSAADSADESTTDAPRLLILGFLPNDTTVNVNVTGGTATGSGTDYTNVVAVTIPAGNYDGSAGTSVPINLTVVDDNILEADENINFELSSANPRLVLGDADLDSNTQATNTYTIQDNDTITVSVTANDAAAAEPADNGQFTINLSSPNSVDTTITYNVAGTATATDDYTPLTGTVTIPAGDTSATIDVTVVDDAIVESDETVVITLATTTDGTIDGANNQATVTISDDDNLEVSIAATVAAASEPATDGEFTVTLNNTSATDTTVTIDYAGTATDATDYNLTGAAGTTTVVIPAGDTSATVAVEVIDDNLVEGNETVDATITAVSNGTIGTASDTVTIADDDRNLDIAPINESTPENTAHTTAPADLSPGDAPVGTVTYTITGGADQALFTIDPATGELTLPAQDFEAPADANADNLYEVQITATDSAGNTATEDATVTVTNVVETANLDIAPIVETTPENTAHTTAPADLSPGDAPIGTVTYTITGGADQALFTIDPATGELTLPAQDFEAPADANADNVYEVQITATDSDGNTADELATVEVTDVAETANLDIAPIAESTPENTAHTTAPADLSPGDAPIGTVTYTITGGADQALFTIDPATGELTLPAQDFEAPADANADNVYEVQITATDSDGNTADELATVEVTDVAETANLDIAPIVETTPENTAHTTAPADLSPGDAPIGTVTYTITGGADQALFTIDANTGELTLPAQDFEAPADANADNVYEVQITATDSDGNTADELATVEVTDVAETANLDIAPIVETTPENTAHTTAPADLSPGDAPVGTVTYTITGGADQALFTIDPATGELTLPAQDFEAPADANADNLYEV
ncbi:Calx-beta domain-containing protein, partial [Kangiella taiwanensis]|uniref:Calx-beta domain-containing protein n=2 Tax=Kangiella taiwanensis TaxID=1079179 RepID=UPI0031E85198